jgi:hypothetical protein
MVNPSRPPKIEVDPGPVRAAGARTVGRDQQQCGGGAYECHKICFWFVGPVAASDAGDRGGGIYALAPPHGAGDRSVSWAIQKTSAMIVFRCFRTC